MEVATPRGTARAENPLVSGCIPKQVSWSRAPRKASTEMEINGIEKKRWKQHGMV